MNIKEFLRAEGPGLSSNIKNELLKKGVSDDAARQQISRAKGDIYRLTKIQFPKREQFLYLKSQYDSVPFRINLVKAFKTTSSIHKCIITGLNNFGNNVPIDKLKIISGCPQFRKNKKTFDHVINELLATGLINVNGTSYSLHENIFSPTKTHDGSRVINYLNEFLREMLALWLKNNNLISYNANYTNGDFCSYRWDIAAPSYLLPLIKNNKTNPGFIVADIIPHYDIEDDDVDYYIRKVESCFLERNSMSFMPILLGYKFKDSTWKLLKSKNILVATVQNFFGEEIEKLLTNIAELLKTKEIKELGGFGTIDNILKAVSKIEGPTNNFRGQFFELVVGYIASQKHPGMVTLNEKISNKEGSKEIDVLTITSNEIIVYECKGKKPQQLITGNDISEWKGKIAFIYRYFKHDMGYFNHKISFNFWTTSDFLEEANYEFEKNSPSKYSIAKKNGKEVFDFSKELNLREICSILKQYFPYECKESLAEQPITINSK